MPITLAGFNSGLTTIGNVFKDVWSTVIGPPRPKAPAQAAPSPAAPQQGQTMQILLWAAVALLGFAVVWPMIAKRRTDGS